ncbi:MAG: DUF1501 domain-containing protein [Planctomycetaceae bacterium]
MRAPRTLPDPPCPRREALARLARVTLGVTLGGGVATCAQAQAAGKARATRVITLWMLGGMSHLDTFDPKPGREEQGPTGTIRTNVPGLAFGAGLPRLAAVADRLTIFRAVTTQTGDHGGGQYVLRTSYDPTSLVRHPSFGSWMLHATDHRGELPGFGLVGDANQHPGCGFLDTRLSPLAVADPDKGLVIARRPPHLPALVLNRRLAIAERFDRAFHERYADAQVGAYDEMYAEAVKLLDSPSLDAFDISLEPDAVRERYGDSRFGKGCLLARRLIEAGLRAVDVDHGVWDMHVDMFKPAAFPAAVDAVDRGLSALLDDLAQRGLLDETLVVLATEFGRSPAINENAGRDHHPAVFSCLMAGAGVRPGMIHGSSDERGFRPDADAITIADFNTTVAAAAGLPYTKEFFAPNGRPFKIGGGGSPVREVLT